MIINVPKEFEQEFLSFLELGICGLEADVMDESEFTEAEQKLLDFVRDLINNPQ